MRECHGVRRRFSSGERLSPNLLSPHHGDIFTQDRRLTESGSSMSNRARAARARSQNGALRAVA